MHMHEAHTTTAMPGHHIQATARRTRGGPAKRPHIVDDVHAQVQYRLHHRRLVGIDRHRHAQGQGMAHHRQNAGQLIGLRQRLRARTCRFTADVQYVSPLGQQLLAMPYRGAACCM